MERPNFRDDVSLDRFNLEFEASRQADRYQYWSEQLADAKLTKDKLESKLKVRSAEVELDFRKNPPEGVKLTESVVSALVDSNEELTDLIRKVNEQKHNVAILESGVRALEQKKSQIETLSRLWIAGYYSAPNKGDSEQSMEHRRALNMNRRARGESDEEQ